MTDLELSDAGLAIDGQFVDVFAVDAVHRIRGILGPEICASHHGVEGTGRTAHWLKSGIVLISQSQQQVLVEIRVCFDLLELDTLPPMPMEFSRFSGSTLVEGERFVGGESEATVRRLPGISGFGGMLDVRRGRLFVGFDFRKPRNRLGKRSGSRRLVQISAEWGGVKPFPKPNA